MFKSTYGYDYDYGFIDQFKSLPGTASPTKCIGAFIELDNKISIEGDRDTVHHQDTMSMEWVRYQSFAMVERLKAAIDLTTPVLNNPGLSVGVKCEPAIEMMNCDFCGSFVCVLLWFVW